MSLIVPIIVFFIVCLQVYFFVMNVYRMKEYKDIFEYEYSWDIDYSPDTGFVSGISGEGNKVFSSIKESISKYLGSNSGSVIDFHLLKDAVDRHCDAVENDINTQTPVPLYCGLAGTMVGVIIGLASLLISGAIDALLHSSSSNSVTADAVSAGVNDLLEGVAWAMLASICGIFFTTVSSVLFKRYKLQGESGKNTFLAWLQAKLLPELPSDTSDALNRLVKNLNKFNNTFAENTSSLRGALREVNESYRIQGDIIKAVHDMDVMKMAKANVRVLEELKECTDKLEQFNEYLNGIHGYTDAIHTFTAQFEQEANRLHVLEEIQQYFSRHKAEIAKDAADSDVALREALRSLRESSESNSRELNSMFVQQAEDFKRILKEEKESFERVNQDLQAQFSSQLKEMPMFEQRFADVAEIPQKIDEMIVRLEQSNTQLYSNFILSTRETLLQFAKASKENGATRPVDNDSEAHKTSWILIVCAIFIAIACIANTIHNIWFVDENNQEPVVEQNYNNYQNPYAMDSVATDTAAMDSVVRYQ